MATSKTTTASSSKKSTAGKTTTKAKKATRKTSTDIVEVEVINEGTYMSDVARKLAGNYDVEERERELAPMIRAKISGTLESRDQTRYAQMAAEVATIGQEHVNAADATLALSRSVSPRCRRMGPLRGGCAGSRKCLVGSALHGFRRR